MSVDDLFFRLAQGDRASFEEIFRTYYAPLVKMAERMVRRRAVAEEIVQDVMLDLWRRREVRVLSGSPGAYLFQASRSRALNHLRHERVERDGEVHARHAAPSARPADLRLIDGEMEAAVQQAIGELPERCRQVFELSRVHGLRYAEIADVMGISIKTVEAQMAKALRILRGRLWQWLPDVPNE